MAEPRVNEKLSCVTVPQPDDLHLQRHTRSSKTCMHFNHKWRSSSAVKHQAASQLDRCSMPQCPRFRTMNLPSSIFWLSLVSLTATYGALLSSGIPVAEARLRDGRSAGAGSQRKGTLAIAVEANELLCDGRRLGRLETPIISGNHSPRSFGELTRQFVAECSCAVRMQSTLSRLMITSRRTFPSSPSATVSGAEQSRRERNAPTT